MSRVTITLPSPLTPAHTSQEVAADLATAMGELCEAIGRAVVTEVLAQLVAQGVDAHIDYVPREPPGPCS